MNSLTSVYKRYSPEELERLSYIENWSMPNGQTVSDLMKGTDASMTLFPSEVDVSREESVTSSVPAKGDFSSFTENWESFKGTISRPRLENTIELLLRDRKALIEYCTSLVESLGLSKEDAQLELAAISPNRKIL